MECRDAVDGRLPSREAVILGDGRALAGGEAGEDFGEEIEAERCQVSRPEFTGRVVGTDRDVTLCGDRATVDGVIEPIDGSAGEGIAEPDSPFDGGTASVARQKARVVAEDANAGAVPCFAADEVVAVGRNYQVDTTGAHAIHGVRTKRAGGDDRQILVQREDVELVQVIDPDGAGNRDELPAWLLGNQLGDIATETTLTADENFHGSGCVPMYLKPWTARR